MKKIFYILILSCALVACGKTENEDDLVRTFIDAGDISDPGYLKLVNHDYFDTVACEVFYAAEFKESSSKKPWDVFKNTTYGEGSYSAGSYLLQAKKGHYNNVKSEWTAYDQNRDFEIFIRFEAVLPGEESFFAVGYNFTDYESGLAVGIKKDLKANSGYRFYVEDLKEKKIQFTSTDKDVVMPAGVIRIRKIGGKISYFFEKKHMLTASYRTGLKSGLAYLISGNSDMRVRELTVKYLN